MVLCYGRLNLSKSLCSLHHRIVILANPCLQSINSGYTSESLVVKHRQAVPGMHPRHVVRHEHGPQK